MLSLLAPCLFALSIAPFAAENADLPPSFFEWQSLPPLPDAIGYGGPFVASVGPEGSRVLVVMGGANFPAEPPWAGGEKVWYDTTWVFDGSAWSVGPPLPEPRAYGAVVHVGEEAWLLGGCSAERSTDAVLVLSRAADGALTFGAGPSLPAATEFHCAGLVGDEIVVISAWNRTPSGYDRVADGPSTWRLDTSLPEPRWRSGATFPGMADQKMVATSQRNARGAPSLFVASGEARGAEPVAVDGRRYSPVSSELWSYEPATDRWSQHAAIPGAPEARGTPHGRSAGTGWAIGTSHIAVFSGVSTLPLDIGPGARAEFAASHDVYHVTTDSWVQGSEGGMPRGVVTTGIAPWRDGFVIASGETRPGVRTNEVQFGRVERRPAPLAALDYGVMALYLAALMVLAGLLARREKTADDFFLAGRRIPWWAAGLSIYATQLSAITYVAIPAKAFVDDWVFALTSLTILAMAPIVVVFYLPFFRRLEIATAYEYLERRFSLGVRLFGSASFMGFQVARMAIVVFLPSLALSTVTGVDIYACIGTIGLLATAYTVIGGFEAVVWTDVLQVAVLLGGLVVALVIAVSGAGGLDEALRVARAGEKLRWFAPGTGWTETASWSVLVGAMFLQFGPYTTDQAVVQRYLSTKDERSAARGIWLNGLIAVPFTFAFFALGSALFAYFSAHPESLAMGMANDEVLPLFLALELPTGLAGLVLAGILAASMSSLDSSMHAIATAWTNDWRVRLGIGRASTLVTGRRVTLIMGLVGTAAAATMAALELRSMYDVFQSVLGLLISPLAGLFFLGIFTTRTSAASAAIGAAAAIGVLAWVQRSTPLNFMLYGAIGTTTCVAVGYTLSLALPNQKDLHALTWWSR